MTALEVSWARIIESFHQIVESVSPEKLEIDLIKAYEKMLEGSPISVFIHFLELTHSFSKLNYNSLLFISIPFG